MRTRLLLTVCLLSRVALGAESSTPFLVGEFPSITGSRASASEGTLFSADEDVLALHDFSSPMVPVHLASEWIPQPIEDIAALKSVAYLAGKLCLTVMEYRAGEGLFFAYWTAPPGPEVLQDSSRLAISGKHVFFAGGETGLHVIEVSDLSTGALERSAHWPAEGEALGEIEVSGGLAFVGYTALVGHEPVSPPVCGVHILDVSDPLAPVLVGNWEIRDNGYPSALAVAGSTLYVGVRDYRHGKHGFYVVDVASAGNPRETGFLSLAPPNACLATGGSLYVATDAVEIFSLADPQRPEPVASLPTAGEPLDLATEGEFLYAIGEAGLSLYSFSQPLMVRGLSAVLQEESLLVSWDPVQILPEIEILVDGISLAVVDAPTGSYLTAPLVPAKYDVCAIGRNGQDRGWLTCLPPIAIPRGASFIRGDCDRSGSVDISDAICMLSWFFLWWPGYDSCLAAKDANLDGENNITDPIFLLNFLFLGGPDLPPPYPGCGPGDPEVDRDCTTFPLCG